MALSVGVYFAGQFTPVNTIPGGRHPKEAEAKAYDIFVNEAST